MTATEDELLLLSMDWESLDNSRLMRKKSDGAWEEEPCPILDTKLLYHPDQTHKLLFTKEGLVFVRITRPYKGKGSCRVTLRKVTDQVTWSEFSKFSFPSQGENAIELTARLGDSFAVLQINNEGDYSGILTPDLGQSWHKLAGTLPFPDSKRFPPGENRSLLFTLSAQKELRLVCGDAKEMFEFRGQADGAFKLISTTPNQGRAWLGRNLTRPKSIYRCNLSEPGRQAGKRSLIFAIGEELEEGWKEAAVICPDLDTSIAELRISGRDDLVVCSWIGGDRKLRYSASKDNGRKWSPARVLETKDYRVPHPDANNRNVRLTLQEAFDNAERLDETFSYDQYLVGPDVVFVRSHMLKDTVHKELIIDWGARL